MYNNNNKKVARQFIYLLLYLATQTINHILYMSRFIVPIHIVALLHVHIISVHMFCKYMQTHTNTHTHSCIMLEEGKKIRVTPFYCYYYLVQSKSTNTHHHPYVQKLNVRTKYTLPYTCMCMRVYMCV